MKLLVGGIIALFLLGIYSYSVVGAIMLAYTPAGGQLNPGQLLALTTIGGLVSALVIAELAIATPGEVPSFAAFGPSNGLLGRITSKGAPLLVILYILTWTVLGAVAFIVGVMEFPGKVASLTDFGQSWLGLAVAAAYAYFGLNRSH